MSKHKLEISTIVSLIIVIILCNFSIPLGQSSDEILTLSTGSINIPGGIRVIVTYRFRGSVYHPNTIGLRDISNSHVWVGGADQGYLAGLKQS